MLRPRKDAAPIDRLHIAVWLLRFLHAPQFPVFPPSRRSILLTRMVILVTLSYDWRIRLDDKARMGTVITKPGAPPVRPLSVVLV